MESDDDGWLDDPPTVVNTGPLNLTLSDEDEDAVPVQPSKTRRVTTDGDSQADGEPSEQQRRSKRASTTCPAKARPSMSAPRSEDGEGPSAAPKKKHAGGRPKGTTKKGKAPRPNNGAGPTTRSGH